MFLFKKTMSTRLEEKKVEKVQIVFLLAIFHVEEPFTLVIVIIFRTIDFHSLKTPAFIAGSGSIRGKLSECRTTAVSAVWFPRVR